MFGLETRRGPSDMFSGLPVEIVEELPDVRDLFDPGQQGFESDEIEYVVMEEEEE